MHSFTTFLTASAFLGFATASPLAARDYCPPENYHICGDGWEGCCSVSPCYAINGKSGCPDAAPSQNPTTTPSASPSATACIPSGQFRNWSPMFWMIQTYNETYTRNQTTQFYVQKDADMTKRRDVIAVFKDLPAERKTCTLSWYKPEKGIFYGTYSSGNMNISTLDLGDKTLEEAAGSDINYKNVKGLFEKQTITGGLDLANWGSFTNSTVLSNGKKFDCPGKEVALHFELVEGEGSVVHDQVSKKDFVNNNFVHRAGWYLQWE